MDAVLSEPVVIYLLVTVAAVLVLVEAAPLPTFGGAGLVAVVVTVGALVGLEASALAWWPLMLVVVAVVAWGVMIARGEATRGQQIGAGVVFAAGSLLFGVLARSAPTVLVGAVASAALPEIFPRLYAASRHLMDRPSSVGMEAFVGRDCEVVDWGPDRRTVRIDGSLWNAEAGVGATTPQPGQRARVLGHTGMTLQVAAAAAPDPGPT